MAISIPSLQDIYNKIKSSIFSSTGGDLEPEKDPFVSAFVGVQSEIIHDLYNLTQDSIAQTFSQTATEEAYLTAIAFDRTNNQVQRKQAEFATGILVIEANEEVDIPEGTQFITSDGEVYESIVDRTATDQTFLITSLERVSNYAIATLTDHQLATGMTITIAGANETAFNGDYEIEVLTADTFRYVNSGSDETATGTITGYFLGVRVDVQSVNAADSANQTFTDSIDLVSSMDEIDNVYITFDGIIGGSDIEDLSDFKARILEYLAYPENKGNVYQYQAWLKQNTDANFAQVFQSEDDLYIYINLVVSKYDDDFDFTNFTTNELDDIEEELINDNQVLLGVEAVNVVAANPTFINIDVTITDLSPNTLDMRDAISNILKEYLALLSIKYYLSDTLSELSEDKIRSIIFLARDSNGNTPSLSSISVDGVDDLDNDIDKPILGTITYV